MEIQLFSFYCINPFVSKCAVYYSHAPSIKRDGRMYYWCKLISSHWIKMDCQSGCKWNIMLGFGVILAYIELENVGINQEVTSAYSLHFYLFWKQCWVYNTEYRVSWAATVSLNWSYPGRHSFYIDPTLFQINAQSQLWVKLSVRTRSRKKAGKQVRPFIY